MPFFMNRGIMPLAAALDSVTTQWSTNVQGAGGAAPSGARLTLVNDFVVGCKNDSTGNLWALLNYCAIHGFGDADQVQPIVDLVQGKVGTLHGGYTLNATGFTGNGSTGYIGSGFVQSTHTIVGDAANYSIGSYCTSTRSDNTLNASMGASTGGGVNPNIYINPNQFNLWQWAVNDSGGTTAIGGSGSAQGFLFFNRANDTSNTTIEVNGGARSSNIAATGGAAMSSHEMTIGAFNNSGSVISFSVDTLVATIVGGNFTASQSAAFAARLKTLIGALGLWTW